MTPWIRKTEQCAIDEKLRHVADMHITLGPDDSGAAAIGQQSVDQLRWVHNDDQPTIGLRCRDKNNIEVEFSLRDMDKPMCVSEYILLETSPDNLKGALPIVEEVESDSQQLRQRNRDGGDE